MAEEVTAKSLLVFYINVGQLPPYHSEALIERMKDNFLRNQLWKLSDEVGTLFIPVRPPQETKVTHVFLDAPSQNAVDDFKKIRDDFVAAYRDALLEVQPPKIKRGFFGSIRHWFRSLFPS